MKPVWSFKASFRRKLSGEFPGGPVVRTLRFHCLAGSIPGWGIKIPQASKKKAVRPTAEISIYVISQRYLCYHG